MAGLFKAKALATLAAAGLLAGAAPAATLTWDADGADPLNDGGGAWTATGGANWHGDGGYGAWSNTTDDVAVFGVGNGAAGPIAVDAVNANGVTFNAPGAGSYTLAGGTITLGGAAPAIAANTNAAIASVLAGDGVAVTKSGAGVLTLSGANTFSGGLTLTAGTLLLGANSTPSAAGSTVTSGPVGTGTLTLAGGRLQPAPTGGKVIANPIHVADGTTTYIWDNTTADLNLNGAITGGGTLALDATISNSLWLRGDPSAFTGTIAFKNNANGMNFRLLENAWNFSRATFVFSGSNGSNRELIWSGTIGATVRIGALEGTAGLIGGGVDNGFTLEVGALDTTTTYAGLITTPASGAIALTKVGAGTLTLSGANTFSGNVTVNAGTLRATVGNIGGATALGQNNKVTVNAGATLDVGGVNGTGNLIGASQLNTLAIIGGTLTFSLSGTSVPDGPYLGVVNLDGAKVTSANGSGPRWGYTQASGAINATNTASTWSAPLWLVYGAGKSLTVNTVVNLAMSGVIADYPNLGGLPFIKAGAGTLTLSGVNTFTGVLTVQAGTVVDGVSSTTAGAFGGFNAAATKIVVQSGATVDINGKAQTGTSDFFYGLTLAGAGTSGQGALVNNGAHGGVGNRSAPNITLADNATIGGSGHIYMINASYNADTLTLNDHVLTKTGSNTFFLCNTTVTRGAIAIAQGTVAVANRASNAAAAAFVLADAASATLALNGFDLAIGSLAGGGAAGGQVALGGNTLTVGDDTSTAFAGVIGGAGNLLKTGSGALALDGTNVYTGATGVQAGTLLVNGTHAAAGPYTVRSGAVLGGRGTLGSAVNVEAGGALAPGGTNATAVLTVDQTVSLAPDATLHVNLAGPAAATPCDRLVLTAGALQLNGAALAISFAADYRPALGTTFEIVHAAQATVGAFAGLPDGAEVAPAEAPVALVIRYDNTSAPRKITLTASRIGGGTLLIVR